MTEKRLAGLSLRYDVAAKGRRSLAMSRKRRVLAPAGLFRRKIYAANLRSYTAGSTLRRNSEACAPKEISSGNEIIPGTSEIHVLFIPTGLFYDAHLFVNLEHSLMLDLHA